MRKVIETIMFFNELDMLDFHLHTMDEVVDYFVICEAVQTYAGNDKPLFFEENINRYKKFIDKIIHVKFEEKVKTRDAWERESIQRQHLFEGIKNVPDIQDSDIILISDTDEIADHNLLKSLGPIEENKLFTLEQDVYYYNLNSRFKEKACCSMLCNFGLTKQEPMHNIRFGMRAQILRPGGWHFSYFSNTDAIITKIQNFSHQDLNLSRIANSDHVEKVIESKTDLFGRKNKKNPEKYAMEHIEVKDNSYLPDHYEMLLNCNDWELPTP